MSTTIEVFYVSGVDPANNVVDVAKFFTYADAEKHLKNYPRISTSMPLRDVGVGMRKETLEEQHPAHRPAMKFVEPKAQPKGV